MFNESTFDTRASSYGVSTPIARHSGRPRQCAGAVLRQEPDEAGVGAAAAPLFDDAPLIVLPVAIALLRRLRHPGIVASREATVAISLVLIVPSLRAVRCDGSNASMVHTARIKHAWLVLQNGQVVGLSDPALRTSVAGARVTRNASSEISTIFASTNGTVAPTVAPLGSIVACCRALFAYHRWFVTDVEQRIVGQDEQAIRTQANTKDAALPANRGQRVDPTGQRHDRRAIIGIAGVRRRVARERLNSRPTDRYSSCVAYDMDRVRIQAAAASLEAIDAAAERDNSRTAYTVYMKAISLHRAVRAVSAVGGRRARSEPPAYRVSQYDILMMNVFAGCNRIRSTTSSRKPVLPANGKLPCRPSFHTANSVDPGRYSQRKTTFDWNSLKLKPPG